MKTVVIIGAGFSGTATAINLLRRCDSALRVVLINRSGSMARGLAYGTSSPQHLLNVPAGNMSVLADESEDFLQFCRGRLAAVSAQTFVSRKLYGDYLSTRLDEAECAAAPLGQLQRINGEARCIAQDEQGPYVDMIEGERIRADQVVLAFGHFTPLNPKSIDPAQLAGCYQQDPWAQGGVDQVADEPVLLIGSGLTALDVVTSLLQNQHQAPIYMLSRRGMMPLSHRIQHSATVVPPVFIQRMLQAPPRVRSLMRLLRSQIAELELAGLDWRDLVAALRPITVQLWQKLCMNEKRRFLRHVQPLWDVHRHRVAPDSYALFKQALDKGQIRSLAGHVVEAYQQQGSVHVNVRLRGGEQRVQLQVAKVLNCTGPNGNLDRVDDRLIEQLRSAGLLQPDALGLGIAVDASLAVLNSAEQPVPWLSYVGPMLKGGLWEATAVPELRQHAAALAARLQSLLPAQVPAGGQRRVPEALMVK